MISKGPVAALCTTSANPSRRSWWRDGEGEGAKTDNARKPQNPTNSKEYHGHLQGVLSFEQRRRPRAPTLNY
eukprot:865923-Prorocentrum_minimum.AAC.1